MLVKMETVLPLYTCGIIIISFYLIPDILMLTCVKIILDKEEVRELRERDNLTMLRLLEKC